VVLLLLASILFANENLISLYADRMKAEEAGLKDKLVLIDMTLADHYLSVSDFKTARIFLENSIANAEEPVLTDRKLDIYRLDMIEGKFDIAESGLINVYFYSKNNDQRSRSSMLLGILYALKGEYEDSRKFLTESLKLEGVWDNSIDAKLDSILLDAKRRKNIETAKWLSTFLPGAGQIYAQNAKGAVGAIGIAAFWGGWFVYDIVQQDYYSAALVLLWPWQRYHRGNIQNAGHSVETYNALIEDNINKALLGYLAEK
jgi:hypothetical protein